MTFDRDKKGYNSAQVDDYIARLNEEHYREAGDLRHRIDELKAELDEKTIVSPNSKAVAKPSLPRL